MVDKDSRGLDPSASSAAAESQQGLEELKLRLSRLRHTQRMAWTPLTRKAEPVGEASYGLAEKAYQYPGICVVTDGSLTLKVDGRMGSPMIGCQADVAEAWQSRFLHRRPPHDPS